MPMELSRGARYRVKVRHIFPVFLMSMIGSVAGLMLVRWLVSIQFNILDLKEEVWNLWIPVALPWIPIIIWLRPRLRILIRKKDADNLQFGFQFLAYLGMVFPVLVSQSYLTSAAGNMIHLRTLGELSTQPLARYYTIQDFKVAPAQGGSAEDIRPSGKHNEHLNINIYFAIPITGDSSESAAKYNCWYGVKYYLQISNRIDVSEKEKQYKAFYEECISKINQYKYHDLQYFKRLPNSDDRNGFMQAITRIEPSLAEGAVILEAKHEDFEARTGKKLPWLLGSMIIASFGYLFALVWPRYSTLELQRQYEGRKPKEDDIVEMLKFLVPKEPHFATSILLDINILVFVVMVFGGVHLISPNAIELLAWGANRRTETMGGEWWRLLTSMFVHGGIMHLALNIYGLVFAAAFLEPLLGVRRYVAVYFVSGLCASVASVWWHENTASVGASGAIFGLFGAILSMLLTNTLTKGGKKSILILFGPFVVINLLFGFVGGGIDNAGHVGGLLCGFLLGLVFFKLASPSVSEEEVPGGAD